MTGAAAAQAAVSPTREAERLAALRRYEVLDTPDEEAFDRIVRLAAAVFGTPIADVSLIDERRQWLKARVVDGQPSRGPREAPREWSLCAHAIGANGVTVVPDARRDERFRASPFVLGEPHIRFYAGAPLRTPDGHSIGTLCVISPEPRPEGFGAEEQQKLQTLADLVVTELELRRRRRGDAQLLNKLLESSSDCIKVLSLDGELESMNEGGLAVMEVDDFRACQGQAWPGFWDGGVRGKVLAALEEARAGRTGRFEGPALTLKGTPKWWDVTVSPILGEDGRPERLLAVSRDVTERRQAEVERDRAAALLRTFADAAPGVVYAKDRQGRMMVANRGTTELVGKPPELYLGKTDMEFLDDKGQAAAVMATDARIMASGVPEQLEEEVSFPGGRRAVWLSSKAPLRDAAGAVVGLVGTSVDVTAQREVERQLRELNETLERRVADALAERKLLADIVDSMDAFVQVVGLDWRFLAVNQASAEEFARIFGVRRPRPGDSMLELLAHKPEHQAAVKAVWARALGGEEFTEVAEFGDPGLDRRAYEMRYSVLRDASGRQVGAYQFVYDVTDRLRDARRLAEAEEALRQAQKMEAVGQLTGGLAHDFNNLLTGIAGSLELLQARIAQGRVGEVERYVAAAQGAAKRAAALTHRLLAFSRRQTLDPRPVNVNRLVAGMEELVRRTVGPAIAVEVAAAGGLWTTLVDAGQLENALLNLCINARDAMPDGGRLTIETGNRWLDDRTARLRDLPPGQYVSLCVSDTGTGMPPDVVARAFDPFFTTKPAGMGTGLGLSMVHGFVRQSGGQVRIYSEPGPGPTQGTMVCLYLPRHHGGEQAEEGDAADAAPPRAEQGETVLVVDDEPTVRMLVTEVLGELGYAAAEAGDGPAGLRILQSDARIDLLITDVGLPGGLNGRQVADAARAVRPGLKVLFITGYAENAAVGNGHLEPGMHVLTKPFAMDALAARIRAILEGG